MLIKKRIPIWILLLILISAGLSAQSYESFQYEIENIKQNMTLWKIGPFRLYPRIRVRDIGYDDNIYGQREDEHPVSDYTATFSPELQVHIIFRDWLILSLQENPEYVFFLNEKNERTFNHTFTPGFKISPLRRFVISGHYRFGKRKQRITSEFDTRTFEEHHRYTGSIFYESSRSTMIGVTGSIRDFYYEDISSPEEDISLSKILNHREKSREAELYYRIFSRSYLFVKGGYSSYDFYDSGSSWRDAYSLQLISGIRFPMEGRIRGLISLGYKKLVPETQGKKGFSGLMANTSFDYKMGRFVFHISYTRDSLFSFSQENIYFIENRYGGGLSFYISRVIRLDYNYVFGGNLYPEAIQVFSDDNGFEEIKRKDVYHIHNIAIVFRVMKATGIGLSVNFWNRDSNYDLSDRARIFIGGYITQDF